MDKENKVDFICFCYIISGNNYFRQDDFYMTDYITTYTGDHFDPTLPEAEHLHIEDIAHALSLICRGNGHVKTFFSVGSHCINCAKEAAARGYSDRLVLACLLHDASEAYLSDVPRPLRSIFLHIKIWNRIC